MKKRNYFILILICALFMICGCQISQDDTSFLSSSDANRHPQRKRAEVRSAFKINQSDTDDETNGSDDEDTEDTDNADNTDDTGQETHIEGIVATKDTCDYIALGNSITCNEIDESLWWGSWGMAATSEEKDYVHLLARWLGNQTIKEVNTTVLDLKEWELAKNRDEVLADYAKYFDENTNLVTIQTGENITENKESLNQDYSNLVKYIKEKAPNAQILMMGEMLWPSEDIEAAKKAACKEHGITFVEMTTFLNGYESSYKSALDGEVAGADGKKHKITNEVVAAHPNDAGMECIYQTLINQITISSL